MADDVTLPGAGAVVATDDVGGKQYQRVKPSLGPDGTAVDLRGLADVDPTSDAGIMPVGIGPGWARMPAVTAISSAPNTAAVIDCRGAGTVILDMTGTYTGVTASIEISVDGGTTWGSAHTYQCFDVQNANYSVSFSSISTNRRYIIASAGATHVRLNVTAISTGTLNVRLVANSAPFPLMPANQAITLLGSAARTATVTSADQSNYHNIGLLVILDVTSITSTPSVRLRIQGKDPASSKYFDLFKSNPVTSVSTNVYLIYPGTQRIIGVSSNVPLPRTWRLEVTHANANSITYSVGIQALVGG